MGLLAKITRTVKCQECGRQMYKLSGSTDPIYVCPECGCSVDDDSDGSNLFFSETSSIEEKHHMMKRLFTDPFMKKYTEYNTFNEFIEQCDYINENPDTITYKLFEKLPKRKWDEYVRSHTSFSSWNQMFEKAVERYLKM
jgi:hypothetical protein